MIVDTHNDLLTELAYRSAEPTPFRRYWHDQLRAGRVGLQVCPLYVPPHQIPDNALHLALRQVAACHRAVSESAGSAVLVRTAADLVGLDPETRMGLMLSMEGAEPIGRDLSLLRVFWELGIRMVSLTWNDRNSLADGSGEPTGAGLSKLGRLAVAELARLGIIIDLAHASERTFYDVMETAPESAAIIVSHAGCRAVFDTPRNLTDGQLRLLAERGGVLGAMAHPLNVDPAEPTIDRYLDHIDHAVRIMGERYVGLGADFIRQVALSGATGDHGDALLPPGLQLADAIAGFSGPADYPALVSALTGRGYDASVLAGVLGENFLRVFRSSLPAASPVLLPPRSTRRRTQPGRGPTRPGRSVSMTTPAAADLPAALTRVPRTATQPDGSQLLTYDQVMARLGTLSASPRIRIEMLGASREGRAIPLVAVTSADAAERLDQIRTDAAQLTRPAVTHRAAGIPVIAQPQLGEPPSGFRVPILFQSSNFGMEANQIPALLELAEFFAIDDSPETLRVLDQLVILITPVINPDGMELARAHWQARPLSPGWPAQGNRYGIEVTREYLHQTEPESRALAHLVRQWHPFLVWEVHEDGIGLGWGHPQTCLCPPISPPDAIGLESPVAASVNDPRLYAEFQRYGQAIAAAWAGLGFDYLYDPEGRHGWPRFPVPGYENLVSPPETRFTQSMQLRGVPAFITESCRVPGSQTWADRITQKVSAGKAVAATAAGATAALTDLVASVHRDGLAGPGSAQFFLLPLNQDPYPLSRALDILAAHEIGVYRAEPDPAEPALVVPTAQPLRATIELLLAADQGRHQSLAPALGLRVRPSAALPGPERAAWQAASLRPVSAAAERPGAAVSGGQWYQLAGGHHATTLASRLLRTPGAEVWRDASAGRFFVRGDRLAAAAQGLSVSVQAVPGPGRGSVQLRLPRIGVYTGQGELENRFNGTVLGWFLAEWELPFRAIGPADINADGLGGHDILIVGAGDAAAILTGTEPASVWRRPPWEPDGDAIPLAEEQIAALRDWVTAGGQYVGIDAGGGILGSRDYLGLVDARCERWNLGAGLVELSIKAPQSPVFAGISGSWSPDGSWREGVIDAMYISHPHSGLNGGCLFSVGSGAEALATVTRPLPVGDVPHLAAAENFDVPDGNAAIVGAHFGAGYAVLFGIEPTYRATFVHTGQLIANLILHSSARTLAGDPRH